MEPLTVREYRITFSFDQVEEKLRFKGRRVTGYMRSAYDRALEIARPKAAYRICGVDRAVGEEVSIDGIVFHSRVLVEKLETLHRVFAYVATCGTEFDEWTHEEADAGLSLWLDMFKEMILSDCRKQFKAFMGEAYGLKGIATMSPGSGNLDVWPFTQQRELFQLLGDVEGSCGVALTDSCLMLPTKSVSGILFPSDVDFVTCSLCDRENCVGRKAPYQPVRI